MVDLTPIITAVLTLIFSLITAFLIPYIKTKVSAEQFATHQTVGASRCTGGRNALCR